MAYLDGQSTGYNQRQHFKRKLHRLLTSQQMLNWPLHTSLSAYTCLSDCALDLSLLVDPNKHRCGRWEELSNNLLHLNSPLWI